MIFVIPAFSAVPVKTSVGSANVSTSGTTTIYTAPAGCKRAKVQVFYSPTASAKTIAFKLNGTAFAGAETTTSILFSPYVGAMSLTGIAGSPDVRVLEVELAPADVLGATATTAAWNSVKYFATVEY